MTLSPIRATQVCCKYRNKSLNFQDFERKTAKMLGTFRNINSLATYNGHAYSLSVPSVTGGIYGLFR